MGSTVKPSRVVCAALLSCLAGCFYLDPVNDQPQIKTVARVCAGASCDQTFRDVHRGDTFQLAATFHDPDGDDAACRYHWTAVACRADQAKCDSAVYDDGEPSPRITVPRQLAVTGEAVQLVRVTLELFDGRGAHATKVVLVTVDDGPSLAVRETARSHAVGGPISLFATYGDPDGLAENVRLTWKVTPPPGVPATGAYTLDELAVPPDPGDPDHLTAGKILVPAAAGAGWDVAVTASDALGQQTVQHATFDVGADQPPCIAQVEPLVAPDDAALPIHAPTRFAVPLVTDDLDPYPAVLGEPLLGTPTFAWSILRPGATAWQPLAGAVANNVELDPAAFAPGERIGVRVEIQDRTHAAVACPADAATCGAQACVQRATWHVEAR
jgi:hypothetical protein